MSSYMKLYSSIPLYEIGSSDPVAIKTGVQVPIDVQGDCFSFKADDMVPLQEPSREESRIRLNTDRPFCLLAYEIYSNEQMRRTVLQNMRNKVCMLRSMDEPHYVYEDFAREMRYDLHRALDIAEDSIDCATSLSLIDHQLVGRDGLPPEIQRQAQEFFDFDLSDIVFEISPISQEFKTICEWNVEDESGCLINKGSKTGSLSARDVVWSVRKAG